MARTVVALYDNFADANAAVRELVDNGFPRDDISIMASDVNGEYSRDLSGADQGKMDNAASGAGVGAGVGAVIGGLGGLLIGLGALAIPGIGPVIAAGPLAAALTGLAGAGAGAVAGGVAGGLLGALTDMGVPNETAQYYAEGIRRGGTLVTVRTDDQMSERARDLMNHYHPIDMNERVSEWRQSGWTGFDTQDVPYKTDQPAAVDSSTNWNNPNADVNQPAETNAYVNQPGTTWDDTHPDANQNADWSRTDTQVNQNDRIDQVSDQSNVSTTPGVTHYSDFTSYDTDFRNHFSTAMTGSGYTYEQYQPAYRYGYDLATNTRYRDRSWDEVEPEAQRYWDERNPGTWDRIKDAVRYAWEEVKDSVS